jgi:hypothetical protein
MGGKLSFGFGWDTKKVRLNFRKELSMDPTTAIKTHLLHVASSQENPNAYLFAQVETNQPYVLGISS